MSDNSNYRGPTKHPKAKAEPFNRRQILGGLSLAGASLASPAFAGQPDAGEAQGTPGTLEYQETDHIRRFYELARR